MRKNKKQMNVTFETLLARERQDRSAKRGQKPGHKVKLLDRAASLLC